MTKQRTGEDLVLAFEGHDVAEIRSILDAGVSVHELIRGKSPIDWLTEMYSRSDRFPECVQVMLDHGAVLPDPLVKSVLLNDAGALAAELTENPSLITHRTSMISTFTPLLGATLLHVAAEYGHLAAAKVLIEHGANVNARADVNADGLNGHTPLFHTVNSSFNRSAPVMQLLLDAGADATIALMGITWGKGFEWETTFFDVTPISYAQFGLMPQVHRKETEIYANIERLLSAAKRVVPSLPNVPNKYLRQ